MGGYLATVTSEAENNFIFQLIDNLDYWQYAHERNFGPWIGRFFENNQWNWVDGENFDFTSWYIKEPNSEREFEFYIHYFSGKTAQPETSKYWNDQASIRPEGPIAYVVEYNSKQ